MTRPIYASALIVLGLNLFAGDGHPAEPSVTLPTPTPQLVTLDDEPEAAMVGDDAPSETEPAPEGVMVASVQGDRIDPTPPSRSVGVARIFTGEISAYCISGLTRSGTQTRPGVVATDRAVIPQWTRMRIDGLPGEYVSEDTVSAVIGQRIDVYMPSCAAAIQFGRQYRTVEVLS